MHTQKGRAFLCTWASDVDLELNPKTDFCYLQVSLQWQYFPLPCLSDENLWSWLGQECFFFVFSGRLWILAWSTAHFPSKRPRRPRAKRLRLDSSAGPWPQQAAGRVKVTNRHLGICPNVQRHKQQVSILSGETDNMQQRVSNGLRHFFVECPCWQASMTRLSQP